MVQFLHRELLLQPCALLPQLVDIVGEGGGRVPVPCVHVSGGGRLGDRLVKFDLETSLLSFKFIHALPQLVHEGLLLLFQSVF